MQTAVTAKYIIGCIYLFSDKWIIFTAGHDNQGRPIMSEIGLLQENRCIYQPIALIRSDSSYANNYVPRNYPLKIAHHNRWL